MHLSPHTLICATFPTPYLDSYLTNSLVLDLLFHMKDESSLIFASNTFTCLECFSFRIEANKECGLVMILHSCFANIAKVEVFHVSKAHATTTFCSLHFISI